MKKFLLGLAAVAILTGCAGRQAEQARQDSLQRALDSMAREEALREATEQARLAEEARLDSIRQDSIAQEEKMKLGQLSFIYHNGDWKKILPKFGFKLISKKTHTQPSDYDEDEIWVITEYVYTRNLNGRKVTFKFDTYDGIGTYCATMIIHDPNEKEKFIKDVKRLNKQKEYTGYIWMDMDHYHLISDWEGEILFDTEH